VIRSLGEELEEYERRIAEEYLPGLTQIAARLPHYHQRKRRDRRAQPMARLGKEIIEIGVTWLELLPDTRLRLLRLAAAHDGEPSSPIFLTRMLRRTISLPSLDETAACPFCEGVRGGVASIAARTAAGHP
jgi:hypothetical protein